MATLHETMVVWRHGESHVKDIVTSASQYRSNFNNISGSQSLFWLKISVEEQNHAVPWFKLCKLLRRGIHSWQAGFPTYSTNK